MKRAKFILPILCFMLLLAGCAQNDKNDDVLHLGLNATIIEIDTENHILYVSDSGNEQVFGGRCAIDCTELIEDEEIIYVDYETHELSVIQFTDLLVGDAIIINAYEKYLNDPLAETLKVEQIQLGTQRLS